MVTSLGKNGLFGQRNQTTPPYGRIVSSWKREAGTLTMDIAIPPNTTATVFAAAKGASHVTESSLPTEKAQGVKFLKIGSNTVVYEITSGKYNFKVVE